MSNTPETDQFKVKFKTVCGEKYWVPLELSERLELELNEAREKAERYRIEANAIMIQRDEAREEAHRFRSLSYARSGIDKSASWFPWEASLATKKHAK